MALPALILSFELAAVTMRMTRSALLEVLREDYIRTAWSKGLTEHVIILRHALKNAFIPVITLIGIQVRRLVGGMVVNRDHLCPPRHRTSDHRLPAQSRLHTASGLYPADRPGGGPDQSAGGIEAAKALGASSCRLAPAPYLAQYHRSPDRRDDGAAGYGHPRGGCSELLGLGVQPPAVSWGQMLSGPARR